jgi:hypothetical protein
MKDHFSGVRRPSTAHARRISEMARRHLVSPCYIHFDQEIFRKTKEAATARGGTKTKATARIHGQWLQ